jgi:predicted MFS family arabinose efflux permease
VALVVRHPTLRGLALGYALNLVTWGILVVVVPVALARHYPPGTWESVSGALWAGAGVAGAAGALAAGRTVRPGREVATMALCMAATALAVWPLAALGGVAGLGLGLALTGLLAGPIDVSVLTLRQRRTDPALLGRVMAVSMSLNLAGFPIGAAMGGMLAAWSLPAAFAVAALASLLAAATTYRLIPDQ